jgi:hypothetical protein
MGLLLYTLGIEANAAIVSACTGFSELETVR